ncbi:hypothetical protein [Streptomyces sp. NPDC101776]|uniref:hypothetical protein n=1 Tax=Streptomyces sp. NPDC101776 TaxID=3366146 RepID=UPI00382FC366
MATTQSDPESDRETRTRLDPQVKVALIGAVALVVAAAVSAVSALMAGWLQYNGPGSGSEHETSASARPSGRSLALIVSPFQGDEVSQCAAVSGVAPQLEKNQTYWLVVRGPGAWSTYYLNRRIEPSVHAETSASGTYDKWGVQATVGGNKKDAGLVYELILVRTETLTDDFASRMANKNWDLGKHLPQGATLVDSVNVRRTATEC